MTTAVAITEKQFSQAVYDLARLRGWLVARYPTWRKTGTTPGFPDLVLVRLSRVLLCELKGERGRVSEMQSQWLMALEGTGKVEGYTWRPSDWDRIEEVLR